jgi:apolipoprotein N-acyltransferase
VTFRNPVIIRHWILPLLTGILYTLSFPAFDLPFLAWFSLVPLLIAVRRSGSLEAFWIGFRSGGILFAGLVYWVTLSMARYGGIPWPATLPVLVLLAAYLAVYIAGFSALLVWIRSRIPFPSLILAPVLWTSLEWVRGHALSGFPWGLLGYSQYQQLSMIQMADITGIYGISFVVVLVNAAIVETAMAYRNRQRTKAWASIGTAAFVLAIFWLYGQYRIEELGRMESRTMRVGVVQANVPQDVKWDHRFRQLTLDRYARLTQRVAGEAVDLIVWPEAAMPFVFEDEVYFRERVLKLVEDAETPVLLGSPGRTPPGEGRPSLTNSAFLVDASGRTLSRQDKIHLVPFGEYVPLSGVLFFVNKMVEGIGDFRAGTEYRVMNLPAGGDPPPGFGVVICFEVIFPEVVRKFASNGAEFMLTITNDAWFGRSSAPYQHFSMMVFRSIENRVPFVRSANTGISGFVDASGRILEVSDIFVEATMSREIRFTGTRTLYTRLGDTFAITCVIITAVFILFRMRLADPFRRKSHAG